MTPDLTSESVSLYFSSSPDGPRLTWFVLRAGKVEVASEGGGKRQFKWARQGPRILALALLRLARWRGQMAGVATLPLLWGECRPGIAASLGDLLTKAEDAGWMADMLSTRTDKQGLTLAVEAVGRLRRWFVFGNVQGKRANEPITVDAVVAELSPQAVEVWLDDERVTVAQLDRLERQVAGSLDGSLPPLLPTSGVRLTGYLPSTQGLCEGREEMLEAIDDTYANGESRLLVLCGAGGAGKTTVAREWLGRAVMAGRVRQPLVFGWSFYRQGYGNGSGQVLAEFYARLGKALGVVLDDGMLPTQVVEALLEAIRRRPVLMFLDGLEVLVDSRCELPCGITDGALGELLYRLGSDLENTGCWVLVASRRTLRESAEWSYPEVQHLKLKPLAQPSRGSADGVRESSALEWSLASMQSQGRVSAEALLAELEAQGQGMDVVLALVRRAVEGLGDTPARALLLGASFFDRPPEWAALRHLLSSQPPLPRLTDRWGALGDEGWASALEVLQGLRLAQLDAEARLLIHSRIIECLAAELRNTMQMAWVEGQRRLCAYFADVPKRYLPESVLEMEPLFRSAWHGTQAGDYRHVFETLVFSRMSRGNAGYPIFELGAYQTAICLSQLMSPDLDSFPSGCDLKADDRALLIHCAAICLRYMDRLEEAYARQKAAWQRSFDPGCTFASIGPIAVHLLRCQHIYGDLADSGPVLRRVFVTLVRSPISPKTLHVSPSFMADGLSIIGSTLAQVLWAKGRHWLARKVLALMMGRICKILGTQRHLSPGMGGPWHALVLLDAGEWPVVEAGLAAGDLDRVAKRNRETGMMPLIRARLASAKAAVTTSNEERAQLHEEALAALDEGTALVEKNRLRWWQCAFHLARAQHYRVMGDAKAQQQAAARCHALGEQHGFKIMVRDAAALNLPVTA